MKAMTLSKMMRKEQMMKQPPKVCQKCGKLKVISLYMDGSCDYACGCPLCEYREAYKEAEQIEQIKRSKR